jgi:hypothetical protein
MASDRPVSRRMLGDDALQVLPTFISSSRCLVAAV